VLNEHRGLLSVTRRHMEIVYALHQAQQVLGNAHPDDPAIPATLDTLEAISQQTAADPNLAGVSLRLQAQTTRLRGVLNDPGARVEARRATLTSLQWLSNAVYTEEARLAEEREFSWLAVQLIALVGLVLGALSLTLMILARRRGRLAREFSDQRARALDSARRDQEAAERSRLRAEKADKAKSHFLATISHEIRTPMTAITGSAELLTRTTTTDRQKEYLSIILSNGEALVSLIGDVLDLSQVEAGEFALGQQSFDLLALLDEVMLLFARKAESWGIGFTLVCRADVCRVVTGDPKRLRQVLVNLVGNALKFTEQGEVHVTVSCPETDQVQVEIRDTGPGIPADAERQIFSAFRQLDGSTTRKHSGTGLGLTISRRLVDAMGGELTVDSEMGEGSTFRVNVSLPGEQPQLRPIGPSGLTLAGHSPAISAIAAQLSAWSLSFQRIPTRRATLAALRSSDPPERMIIGFRVNRELREAARATLLVPVVPFSDDSIERADHPLICIEPVRPAELRRVLRPVLAKPEPIAAPPAPEPAAAKPPPLRTLGLDILIVDDNALNRQILGELLEALGCVAESVSGGAAAVASGSERHWDLIFMDLDMPDMDGVEATLHLRSGGGPCAEVPIIGLSGHATEVARQRCLSAGMNDFMTKPIRLAELEGLLDRLLEENAQLAQASGDR